ncbi:hypothetical protein [Reinekea sp.]|jgi:hypothetical protein|uniref:hypothetical protein n=1 Tax=Reinekea sp. TaxID=1970455 RepID=UPI00398A221E
MNIPGLDLASGRDMSISAGAETGDVSGSNRFDVDGGRISGAQLTFNQGSGGVMSVPALIGLALLGVGGFYLMGRK